MAKAYRRHVRGFNFRGFSFSHFRMWAMRGPTTGAILIISLRARSRCFPHAYAGPVATRAT